MTTADELKVELEARYACKATLFYVASVIGGGTMWGGQVHVFDLEGHPDAIRAYVWRADMRGTGDELHIVLQVGEVATAADAVRAVSRR